MMGNRISLHGFLVLNDTPSPRSQLISELIANFPPTHCGRTANERTGFDRSFLEQWFNKCITDKGEVIYYLHRNTSPAYKFWVSVSSKYKSCVRVATQTTQAEAKQYFDLIETLIPKVDCDYCTIDCRWEAQNKIHYLNEAIEPYIPLYEKEGPKTLFAKNYFGQRLCKSENLVDEQLTDRVRVADNGIHLDLAREPWKETPETLKKLQVTMLPLMSSLGF